MALAGSERQAPAGAQLLGPADPAEKLDVTVVLRPPARAQSGAQPEAVTRSEFARLYGARPEDVGAVRTFAHAYGLRLIRINLAERTVVLAGTVASCSRAFRVDLGRYEVGGNTYRGREGPIHLPEALAGAVIAVLGLDDRLAAERR